MLRQEVEKNAHAQRHMPALHPGDAGNRALAEGMDLPLLLNDQSPRPAYRAVLK